VTVVCSKPAVLFVDDEEKILRAFRRQLGHKFKMYTASGVEAGLEALDKQDDIAVVVVDFRMPGMNGLEFIAAGRKIRPNSLWIMLSGYAAMDVTSQAINEEDVFRFLAKPCSTERLKQEIDAALQHHSRLMDA
jgi:DNA-binding NtrC family response regulator